jgi:outer membrane protein assembly factor BamB
MIFLRITIPTYSDIELEDDWNMFHHDPEHSGLSSSSSVDSNNTLWIYKTENIVHSSPAVVGGKLYVGSNDNYLYCINAETGACQWKFDTNSSIYSSPAVVDDRVYIGSLEGTLYCLDALNGKLIWKRVMDKIFSSPTVVNEKLFIGSYDGKVYCIEVKSGNVLWSYQTNGWIDSSPAVANGRVFIGSSDGAIYCLTDTGTFLWKFQTGNVVHSSPAVANGRVYVGSDDGNMYCLDEYTGNLIWSIHIGAILATPAVAYGKVYVGSLDNRMYCLSEHGKILWVFNTDDSISSSVAVADGKIYFGSDDKYVYCLSDGGGLIWKYRCGDAIRSSPAIYDGRLFVGSNDFRLYCFGMEILRVSLVAQKYSISSNENLKITVYVTDGENPIPNAKVSMYSSIGGSFSNSTGFTTATGNFDTVFTAPIVTSKQNCVITAETSKIGYIGSKGALVLTIYPRLFVSVVSSSPVISTSSTAEIRVMVSNGTTPIYNAFVRLSSIVHSSSTKGSFSQDNGTTGYDGEFVTKYIPPAIGSIKVCTIIAHISKLGYYESTGYTNITVIPTTTPKLHLTVIVERTNVTSDDIIPIQIYVTDGVDPVPEVEVILKSPIGTFNISTEYTDINGSFRCEYIAPKVKKVTEINITVEVSKYGFESDYELVSLTINPDEREGLNLWLFTIVVAIVVLIVVGVCIWWKKRR